MVRLIRSTPAFAGQADHWSTSANLGQTVLDAVLVADAVKDMMEGALVAGAVGELDPLRLRSGRYGSPRDAYRRPASARSSMQSWPCRTAGAPTSYPCAGRAPVPALHDRQPLLSADRAEPAGAEPAGNAAWQPRRTGSGWPTSPTSRPAKTGCVSRPCSILATRKIVGRAMRDHIRTELPLAAPVMAAQRQRPAPGLICHSDRGSQYAAGAYVDHLALIGATPSMSRTGNCYGNAQMRASTPQGRTRPSVSMGDTGRSAPGAVRMYQRLPNRRRMHSALGCLTPEQAEQRRTG